MIFIVFLTFPRRKIFHYSDAQDRYTENEFIRKGDDGSKENYRIVTESGKQLFNQNYTEAGANRIWEMYNGIYTDDNGNQEYIYVEKI